MSMTYVVAAAWAVDTPTSAAVPDFMILPGAYITALWASNLCALSTLVHVCAATSSTVETIASREALDTNTRPSGSTNVCGYSGRLFGVSWVHVFVVESYTSGVATMHVSQLSEPDMTRKRP